MVGLESLFASGFGGFGGFGVLGGWLDLSRVFPKLWQSDDAGFFMNFDKKVPVRVSYEYSSIDRTDRVTFVASRNCYSYRVPPVQYIPLYP